MNSLLNPDPFVNAVPSSPPLNVTREVAGSRSILLSWEPPEYSEHNGVINGYSVHVFEVATNNSFAFNRTSHTELLIQQLHPYYEYQCSVAALTSVGKGPLSVPILV